MAGALSIDSVGLSEYPFTFGDAGALFIDSVGLSESIRILVSYLVTVGDAAGVKNSEDDEADEDVERVEAARRTRKGLRGEERTVDLCSVG